MITHILLLLLAANSTALDQVPLDVALDAINNAENADELVDRFNNALYLLKQAESQNFETCVSYDDCVSKADALLVSIINDSVQLKEDNNDVWLGFIYIPVSAFLASVASIYFYEKWNIYRVKRLLGMEIRIAEE